MSAISVAAQRAVPNVLQEMFSRRNRFITLIAVLAALGGFLFGYDTGVVGGAAPYIKQSLGIGSFGESWVVGSLLLGAVVGAFASGKLADLLSRKWNPCRPRPHPGAACRPGPPSGTNRRHPVRRGLLVRRGQHWQRCWNLTSTWKKRSAASCCTGTAQVQPSITPPRMISAKQSVRRDCTRPGPIPGSSPFTPPAPPRGSTSSIWNPVPWRGSGRVRPRR